MRISDIIVEETPVRDTVIDLLTVLNGEGVDSVAIDALQQEISNQGIDVDHNSLFDLLDTLPIVHNIKDDVVYFSSDSEKSRYNNTQANDIEKQEKKVANLAKKQVKKELDI